MESDGGEKGKTWAKMKEWERQNIKGETGSERTRLKHTPKRIRERKRGKAGGLGCYIFKNLSQLSTSTSEVKS